VRMNRIEKLFIRFWLCTAFLLFGAAIAARAGEPATNGEWRLIGQNDEGQHFSALEQINSHNVQHLGIAWVADMPTEDGMVGVPLVANGMVFQSGSLGSVYANDARTGKLLWTYKADIKFPLDLLQSWGVRLSRGLALWKDEVLFTTGDCRLIALDLKTGAKRWETRFCGPDRYSAAAPNVGGGKVFVGNGNGDAGDPLRGYVDAFDAATGKHLWRFYTVPGDPGKGFESAAMAAAAKTWGKNYWKSEGGGTVWNGMTYDKDLNRVYLGTDGPSPMNPRQRTGNGDELYTASIIALDANTGAYLWHYQTVPHDGWNFDATMNIVVANLKIDGRIRRVVMNAPKNGFFYVLDALTGKLLAANNFVPVNWASGIDMKTGRPIELPQAQWWARKKGVLLTPTGSGAHSFEPMGYSPLTGLVYIPAARNAVWQRAASSALLAGVTTDWYMDLHKKAEFTGDLVAWDPVGNQARWHREYGTPRNGGILVTAGNLVFEGTTTGTFYAFDAKNGKELWSDRVGGVYAAPSTVEIDGHQMIYLPVGSGTTCAGQLYSPLLGYGPTGPARLIAFELNGKTKVDTSWRPAPMTKPPLPRPSPILAQQGSHLWEDIGCAACHGYRVIAGEHGSVPDLRRMDAGAYGSFSKIVLGGLFKDAGMPVFAGMISTTQLEDLKSYILQQAWSAYDAQQLQPAANRGREQ
jgi:PQQ-dependent dehydrogenase (methanol/ethanol family)